MYLSRFSATKYWVVKIAGKNKISYRIQTKNYIKNKKKELEVQPINKAHV